MLGTFSWAIIAPVGIPMVVNNVNKLELRLSPGILIVPLLEGLEYAILFFVSENLREFATVLFPTIFYSRWHEESKGRLLYDEKMNGLI